jgi:hypothetical protein
MAQYSLPLSPESKSLREMQTENNYISLRTCDICYFKVILIILFQVD